MGTEDLLVGPSLPLTTGRGVFIYSEQEVRAQRMQMQDVPRAMWFLAGQG